MDAASLMAIYTTGVLVGILWSWAVIGTAISHKAGTALLIANFVIVFAIMIMLA